MNRIIPRDLIRHLEWNPKQDPPKPPQPPKAGADPKSNSQFSIDDILSGRTFYNTDKNSSGLNIGVAVALKQTLEYATSEGIIATMPELIAAKVKAEKTHDFWKQWYTVHTEENIGIDKKGRFYSANEPVLVVVHGGGILTPDRIMKAYDEGLAQNSAKYTEEEFENLLEGRVGEETIELHNLEEIKKGILNLPHRFGVVMPYQSAQSTLSDYQDKKTFLENSLVIARNGGLSNLENYFEKTKSSSGKVGNWHPFSGRNPSQPQGRLLFLYSDYDGLGGVLDNLGCFVGVAPEAPGAKK